MATLRLLFAAALLALPLWVAQTTPAQACICPALAQGDTYEDYVARRVGQADLIVVGRIGEMLVLPPESVAHPEQLSGRTPVEVKFEVTEFIKGSAPNPLLVFYSASNVIQDDGRITSIGGTDCDILPHLGQNFVMFLRREDSLRYATDVCSGTRDADLNIPDGQPPSEYIAQIRALVARGLPPTGSGPPSHNNAPVPLIAASALAAVGLAANAAYALRRR